MRAALLLIGFVALLTGLLWIGQGTGTIRWPASSFMINAGIWALYGLLLAAAGVTLIVYARRRA